MGGKLTGGRQQWSVYVGNDAESQCPGAYGYFAEDNKQRKGFLLHGTDRWYPFNTILKSVADTERASREVRELGDVGVEAEVRVGTSELGWAGWSWSGGSGRCPRAAARRKDGAPPFFAFLSATD